MTNLRVNLKDELLTCPQCGGDYLHHARVDVGARPQEDGAGKRVIVHPCGAVETREVEERYSSKDMGYRGRRGEVLIDFTCELCEFAGRLLLLQHKGQTFLSWERD